MFKPSRLEKVIHKIKVWLMPYMSSYRRKKINNNDFSIISNNCWGGVCYEYFGLLKQSPTVGTFIFAKDYLKFVSNLKYYVNIPLKFIDLSNSAHFESLKDSHLKCPVGVLDDVEIFFLHYKNEQIAKEKWDRRIKRINWNNLIFKFSFMNECSYNDLKEFDKMYLHGKKILFVNKPDENLKNSIYYPGYENDEQIENDTFYWNRYLDVVALINKKVQ